MLALHGGGPAIVTFDGYKGAGPALGKACRHATTFSGDIGMADGSCYPATPVQAWLPTVEATPKSIKMPAALLADWLATLRSGEVKQGKQHLIDNIGRMCCLGVLEFCHHKHTRAAVELNEFPSAGALRSMRVVFKPDREGEMSGTGYDPHLFYKGHWTTAASLNDDNVPFEVLADLIEAHSETLAEGELL